MSSGWDKTPPKGGEGVPIKDHKPGQCRWPLGSYHAVATVYCGEPVKKTGCSYCAVHYARSRSVIAKP